MPQVKFKVDYSGGRGKWRSFKNTCRRTTARARVVRDRVQGERRHVLGASELAADAAERRLRPVAQRAEGLGAAHLHWTGELAELEVYQDWVYGGRFQEVFGRATYRGEAIHGFKTTHSGTPLDTYGRLIFLDTLNSQYGPGWKRENSFVVHNPSGMFCYGFYPYSSYGSYPRSARRSSPASASATA